MQDISCVRLLCGTFLLKILYPTPIFYELCLATVVEPSCMRFRTLHQFFLWAMLTYSCGTFLIKILYTTQLFLWVMLTYSCGILLLKISHPTPILFVRYDYSAGQKKRYNYCFMKQSFNFRWVQHNIKM